MSPRKNGNVSKNTCVHYFHQFSAKKLTVFLKTNVPIISFLREWLFGIKISTQCAAGVAVETPCVAGLSYDPENHVCNYPDSIPECANQAEAVIGFKCPHPAELPPNAVARR
jgi:hypothetical protein